MNIIGVGTDVVECLRIAQMIERYGEIFINRVFSDAEIEYCHRRKAATQHFAGRWAGKEAVLKALGTGMTRGLRWKDIEIRNNRGGQPEVIFRGAARDLVGRCGVAEMLVSLSHCRTHAVAYAIALGNEDE